MTLLQMMGLMPQVSCRPNGMVYGGGGGGATSTTSLPDWYQPYIKKAAGSAISAYDNNQLGQVAGRNPLQQQATEATLGAANTAVGNYGAAKQSADNVAQVGQYGYNPNLSFTNPHLQGLKQVAAHDFAKQRSGLNQGLNSANAIGGARGALLKQEADSAERRAYADLDYQDYQTRQAASQAANQQSIANAGALNQLAATPAAALTQAGDTLQTQTQAERDAAYVGLSQLGSLLSGTPSPGSKTTQTGGGK